MIFIEVGRLSGVLERLRPVIRVVITRRRVGSFFSVLTRVTLVLVVASVCATTVPVPVLSRFGPPEPRDRDQG